MTPDINACAVWLQARGLFVFPVDHPALPQCVGSHRREPCNGKRGKHPCGRWSRDATRDPATIRAALARGPRNLGVACGPSELLVVDEDRRGAFAEYASSVGRSPDRTFAVNTAQGTHYYFRRSAGVLLGNSPGALASWGIDVRGHGGFVVAPGSVHMSGVVYAPVDSSASVLPLPGWLADALRSYPQPGPIAHTFAGSVRDLPAYVQGALQGEVARVRDTVSGRNNALNKSAYNLGRYVGAGMLPAELVTTALFEAASVHFGPTTADMSPSEARATIRSGLNAGMRRPRDVVARSQ